MISSSATDTRRDVSTRVGVYFGVLQLFFTLTWFVYVLYLPRLLGQAGIDAGWVPWILALDQAVFVICDTATGIASDRVARVVGRLGTIVAVVTTVSVLAFLLLPFVATAGAGVFLTLTVVWAITSSALRAPPLKLLGRYTPPDRQPWLASLFLLGMGLVGAISPFLSDWATEFDPRIMFAVAAVSLVVVSSSMVWADKRLAASPPPPAAATERSRLTSFALFLVAVALLAVGYQVHFFVNSPAAIARLGNTTDVLLPLSIFWVGFSLLTMPAALLAKRFGAAATMFVGAVVGAVAAYASTVAPSVFWFGTAHFVCGVAWALVMMSALTAALAFGRPDREGAAAGFLYSVLAAAAVARIALTAGHVPGAQPGRETWPWLPVVCWSAAALLLVPAARRRTPADSATDDVGSPGSMTRPDDKQTEPHLQAAEDDGTVEMTPDDGGAAEMDSDDSAR